MIVVVVYGAIEIQFGHQLFHKVSQNPQLGLVPFLSIAPAACPIRN